MERQETEIFESSSDNANDKQHHTSPARKPGRPRIYSTVEEASEINRVRSIKNFRKHQLAQSEKYKQLIEGFSQEKLLYQRDFLTMKLELVEKQLEKLTA